MDFIILPPNVGDPSVPTVQKPATVIADMATVQNPTVPNENALVVQAPTVVTAGTSGSSALWTGQGAPTVVIGAKPGDEYLDTLSGTVYQLT